MRVDKRVFVILALLMVIFLMSDSFKSMKEKGPRKAKARRAVKARREERREERLALKELMMETRDICSKAARVAATMPGPGATTGEIIEADKDAMEDIDPEEILEHIDKKIIQDSQNSIDMSKKLIKFLKSDDRILFTLHQTYDVDALKKNLLKFETSPTKENASKVSSALKKLF